MGVLIITISMKVTSLLGGVERNENDEENVLPRTDQEVLETELVDVIGIIAMMMTMIYTTIEGDTQETGMRTPGRIRVGDDRAREKKRCVDVCLPLTAAAKG